MTVWLTIIGVGDDGLEGLSASSLVMVQSAAIVFASERIASKADVPNAELFVWETGYDETLAALLKRRGSPVIVLATGDPMHFGIGATLSKFIKPAEMTVIPHNSAFSLAAARLGWPLQDAACISLHGRPVANLARHLAPRARILALTSSGKTVSEAAALLTECGYGRSRLTVLEHMGGAKEARHTFAAQEAAARSFADLNTLAIECETYPVTTHFSTIPGLPDDAFHHDGQLTKREVRAATLARLMPYPNAVLWDIGAGCGSIGIEWMRAARGAKAIAIEENAGRLAIIETNAGKLGVPDLKIVQGSAPGALAGLPEPDAVFVGGGVTDAGVFEAAFAAMRQGGVLVANAVTVEGEARLVELARLHNGALSRIAVSRAEPVGSFMAFKPLMPVTTLTIRKKAAE